MLNRALLSLQEATRAGTGFVFGFIGGGDVPYEEKAGTSSFILAFQALPLILVMSALSALLFYLRILPLVVRLFAFVLRKTLGVGGALGLGAAANVFVGMVEAPLIVRPYLSRLSRSELFALMTCGMATVAGTMMALYAAILTPVLPNAMGHILTASLISAPAAIMVARVMIPETGSATWGEFVPSRAAGVMDAITTGALDGLKLFLNIIAILIVLVALVSLLNQILAAFGSPGLQELLGFVLRPVVWSMGIPWEEARAAGSLMGTKIVLNEIYRLSGYERAAGGDVKRAQHPDHDLCPVRFCQFRQPWHPHRRDGRHGPGPLPGDRGTRDEGHYRGRSGHVPYRRRGGGAGVMLPVLKKRFFKNFFTTGLTPPGLTPPGNRRVRR
uniref:Nucleoside transporter n=1 Tax=Candidatus Kentrum sp. DK TaxID=2126562 RepID=A0A450T128_9GAMM|nr:MAG: nucleoside transporter [Candidatus Kentron sp. DK]